MKTENKNPKNFINLASFIMLIIIALLTLVNNFLPIIGIKIGGLLFDILSLLREIFVLVIVSIFAYKYVSNKSKGFKITYWIAFGLFLAGIILMLF